jgi:2-aminoadipate transaminase
MMTFIPEPKTEPLSSRYRFARRMMLMPPSAVREILKVAEQPDVLSFAGGLPAPELFPVAEIAAAHAEVLASQGGAALQYSATEGYGPLREWIAARLGLRGIRVTANGVLITSGSQQGIDLLARVLLDPGDHVAVESPSYLAALQTFAGCEARCVPVPSDEHGIDVDALERAVSDKPIKLLYLVPDFHNPTGITLAAERRAAILRLAATHRFIVLEDDPYGELRFRGEAPPALASLDEDHLVVRLGTFSKTLAPGLRIGFMTAPTPLLRAVAIAKQAADLHTATLPQRATATLLETFDYDGHLARLRAAYGERCVAMLAALDSHMPAGARWTKPDGGMFVWLELPKGLSADELFPHALKERVAFVPGSGFFPTEGGMSRTAAQHRFMRLNYSNRAPALIEEGMSRLGRVIRERMA